MPIATYREQIAAGLFNLVSASVGKVVGLQRSERRMQFPQDVNTDQTPALFQVQVPEKAEYKGHLGVPAIRTMQFHFLLYTCDALNPSIIPSQQLNAMVDAVADALTASPVTGTLTLGGIVLSARIEGAVEYYEGIGDGKSVAIVPVSVLIPS